MLEENKFIEKLGQRIGYVFSYIVFTTILFYLLNFLNKLPDDWNYFNIAFLTFFIALLGLILKRLLK